MGILTSAKRFLRRNPALELLLGIGICTAAFTPIWIIAGKYPGTELPHLPDSKSSSEKDMESSKFKLFKEKFFQLPENEKLNFLVQEFEKPNTTTPHLNKESEASSSGKP